MQGPIQVKNGKLKSIKGGAFPAEGIQGLVATDGSLLSVTGKLGVCGWSLVQLEYDGELRPLHGMYGTVEAAFEVQRTIKRAALTAFLCLLKKFILDPLKYMSTTKKLIDGLWRGERKCIDPKAGDVNQWIKIWEELQLLTSKEILVEVKHVKAHRTEKDKKETSHVEKLVTEGNEKADELATEGALLDEGFMAQTRAKTVKQERDEVYADLQYAASFHSLVEGWKDCEELKPQPKEKWIFVDKKIEEAKHRCETCDTIIGP